MKGVLILTVAAVVFAGFVVADVPGVTVETAQAAPDAPVKPCGYGQIGVYPVCLPKCYPDDNGWRCS